MEKHSLTCIGKGRGSRVVSLVGVVAVKKLEIRQGLQTHEKMLVYGEGK